MNYKPLIDSYTTTKNSKSLINNYKENEDRDNYCFDCGKSNPEYISINNGIFICRNCGIKHMLFPGGASILIKNNINLLSDYEILYLKYGGNRKLYQFILDKSPSLISLPRKFLYNSPFIDQYQKQLQQTINEQIDMEKTKKELFQNKLYNLQINNNFNPFINPSLKRFNTTNIFSNTNIICDDNKSCINNNKNNYTINNG